MLVGALCRDGMDVIHGRNEWHRVVSFSRSKFFSGLVVSLF